MRGLGSNGIWKSNIPIKIQILLWQTSQNAILPRDNMKKKRQWPNDPRCSFCDKLETARHLLFLCLVSTVVWRTIGSMLGTDCCPNSIWRYYVWMYAFLSGFDKLCTVGLAPICWAIWLARNRATFEFKWINSPFEIVFTACTFMIYWAGLQNLIWCRW